VKQTIMRQWPRLITSLRLGVSAQNDILFKALAIAIFLRTRSDVPHSGHASIPRILRPHTVQAISGSSSGIFPSTSERSRIHVGCTAILLSHSAHVPFSGA